MAHDRAKQEIMECLLATIRVSPGVFSRVGRGAVGVVTPVYNECGEE